ncbi:uncharacterized protein [Clytia hemisphaerica]|uniref:uncharacterized protein n=1 Tax=Clytia hemisphaerica TaxID=252671 RepID=UPI0034D6F66D
MAKRFTDLILAYLHLSAVFTHNIIRSPSDGYNQARFVLRHINKVHATAHYSQSNVTCIAKCVDKCVTDTNCKSVNFFLNQDSDTLPDDICQLVSSDLTDKYEYTEKPGWKHYDTGRSVLTRITVPAGSGCMFPESGSDCSYVSTNSLELRTGDECNSVRAYFEYDRDAGTLKHYCSGLYVCPNSIPTTSYIAAKIQSLSSSYKCQGNFYKAGDEQYKWRTNFDNGMEFKGVCLYVNELGVNHNFDISHAACYDGNTKHMFAYDFEQGPVKASIYYSTESHTTYSGFVDYIKGRIDYNSPPRVEYLNDFSWFLSSPWDHVGIRLQAAFRAQETGEYTFTIQGDDYGVMYIHSCMTCTDYVRVARFTISQCFNCPTNSESWPIAMEKDTAYYVEVFFLDTGADDNLNMRMTTPSGVKRPVSFNDLEPWAPTY